MTNNEQLTMGVENLIDFVDAIRTEEQDNPELYQLHEDLVKYMNKVRPGKNYIAFIPDALVTQAEMQAEEYSQ